MSRADFSAAHPDLLLIDPANGGAVARYLVELGLLPPGPDPVQVSRAGDGNMNCTLRVVTPERRLIVKQGRPWVEPALVHVDRASRIIVLEDVDAPDYAPLYSGARLDDATADALSRYLLCLHTCRIERDRSAIFANREMRSLNHEHIFRFPLQQASGLDLDAITPGLQAAADRLKRDAAFSDGVTALGGIYLADGPQLVHGDFFPGSWLQARRGPVVIDPEFCFLGHGEFDFGVMLAHLILAAQSSACVARVRDSIPPSYDRRLIDQFAGVEILRRLIGVAQLTLVASLKQKRAWLDGARELVLAC